MQFYESDSQECTPLGSLVTNEPVTLESISKLFDAKLAPGSTFMFNLRAALREDMQKMVDEKVNCAMETVMNDLSSTTDFIFAEQKDILTKIAEKETRIVDLEAKLSKSRGTLATVQTRLAQMENISRSMNVEIHEIPENKNEDLMFLLKKLCECLQVVVADGDIKACRRVANRNSDSKRPRNILISLSSQRLRDTLLSSVTRFNKAHRGDQLNFSHLVPGAAKSRIYLSEHLSPEAKELHGLARKFCKDKNFKFVWVRFGIIYVRKDEKSPAMIIKDLATLNKLIGE